MSAAERPAPDAPAALEKAFVKAEKKGVLIHDREGIKQIVGDKNVERVILKTAERESPFDVESVFIFCEVPTGPLFAKVGLTLDHEHCLTVDRFQRKNLEGAFAAGDPICGRLQVVSAAGERSIAALRALGYLRKIG